MNEDNLIGGVMGKMWLDILGVVLNSVDTDYDVFSGGLNAAKASYEEKRKIFRRITIILFIICAGSIAAKYFVF